MADIYYPQEDSYLLSSVLEEEIPIFLETKPNSTFLEIGVGSGIQLKSALKSGIKNENIFSCDLNSKAVKNAKRLGFYSIQSDLFENFNRKFDIIVFNPPYLPEDSREPIDSRLATTGGKRGGETINRFLAQAKDYLEDKGKIFLLTSSLTKGIRSKGYDKRLLASKKLFQEKLYVWELTPQ